MTIALIIALIIGAIACLRAGIVGESPIAFLGRIVQPGGQSNG